MTVRTNTVDEPRADAAPIPAAVLVHELLRHSAMRTPEAVALIDPQGAVTYRDLDALADRYAALFAARGVRRGDRVILAIDNGPDFVGAYFGITRAGGVVVPLPPGPKSDRLAHAIADCTPAACIVDAATANDPVTGKALCSVPVVLVHRDRRGPSRPAELQAEALAAALAASAAAAPVVAGIDLDLAAIVYTSGSTGAPRGVMLSHRNILANARSIVAYLELGPRDRVMCVLPFYYVYGLSLLHTHVAVGGTVVVDNRFTYPNVVLAAMQTHRVTGFAGVPSTFALLLHRSNLAEMSFPDLRYVTQAGGSMPPSHVLQWLERGPQVPFFVMYGATEASARLCYLPPADLRRKLGSIGRAIPNVEITVIREDGAVAGPGEVGELVARGANISSGYWNNAEETRARFSASGYRTGDLGYADEDGFLFLVGRRHDMIKVGAHRVGAREIEDVLHEHAGVQEAAVVAAPHDILGEVPVAFVAVAQPDAFDAGLLEEFCRARLAAHKVPVRFIGVRELPKLPGVAKIDKVSLRKAVAQQDAPATTRDAGREN